MGSVQVNITNGNLQRTVQTADGVVGLVICGVVSTGAAYVGTPFKINSITELASVHGMTHVGEPYVYRNVQEFYSLAGIGAELNLLLYPETVTMREVVDTAGTFTAQPLIDFVQGKLCFLGICRNPSSEPSVPGNFVMQDVMDAIAVGSNFVEHNQRLNQPFRIVLEGRIDNDNVTPQDLRTQTNRYSMVMIGSPTQNDHHASIGLVLGRLVNIPVQRKVSRTKDGGLPITQAWLKSVEIKNGVSYGNYIDKGYCMIRTYQGKTVFYFSGDPTAVPTTDDYATFSNGRVVDKAHRIAYQVYFDEIDEEVDNEDDGKIAAGTAKTLEGRIESQVRTLMSGEISKFDATVDTDQNVIATSQTEVEASIRPKGYSSDIVVNLGFNNPFNNN